MIANTPTAHDGLFEITIRGSAEEDAECSPKNSQSIYVSISGKSVFAGLVHTTPDDPAAPHIVMRSPNLDVGSPRALALAQDCIDECVREHEHCIALSVPDPLLPTRLIDCIDPVHPRLVASMKGQRGQYVTLSYVWGGDQTHKTTLSNLSAYERRIDSTFIPQTIRDAIDVTHALGLQLLWVDSLCIIQDSDEDKRRELGLMHSIYRYAHLTIIAANAERVADGFLHERPPPPQVDFNAPFAGGDLALPFLCPPDPLSSTSADAASARRQVGQVYIATQSISHLPGALWPNRADDLEPIGTRGWCMQEYLMSPRSLIFTSKTLQFRCLTTTQNVGNSLRDTLDEWRIPSTLFLPDPPLAERGSPEWDDVHAEWLGVLGDYSRRTLTLASDKLVACAAIAEQFHRVLRVDYLAGMWRDTLLSDMLWRPRQLGEPLHRPTEYRAPSWSWAAVEGALSWCGRGPGMMILQDEHPFVEVVGCEVALQDTALPFGQVTDGTLVLRGPLLRCLLCAGAGPKLQRDVLLQPVEQARGRQDLASDAAKLEVDPKLRGIAYIDCEGDIEVGRAWVVPIMPRGGPGYTQWMGGLVVTEASTKDPGRESGKVAYRRIGYFSFTFEETRGVLGEAMARKAFVQALRDGDYPSIDIDLV